MIFNRGSTSKDSLGKRKAYAHHFFSVDTSKHPPCRPIIFILEDGERVSYIHDDLMMVVVDIDGFTVKRILVDSKSSYNILSWEATAAL